MKWGVKTVDKRKEKVYNNRRKDKERRYRFLQRARSMAVRRVFRDEW